MATSPFEVALVEASELPTYQKIARKALPLRELGLSDRAIAVRLGVTDRRRLERLCRYVARPPLAHDRLEVRPDGRLALRLKARWRDGTTHILMECHELLEWLVPLIPPPRAHQVRYHGVLAPCVTAS